MPLFRPLKNNTTLKKGRQYQVWEGRNRELSFSARPWRSINVEKKPRIIEPYLHRYVVS